MNSIYDFKPSRVRVYLSYRFDYKKERKVLQQACEEKGPVLVYDENELKDGDSIIRFMDKLADARFVLILLSRDYFKSAYTMHEFLLIHERIKNNADRLEPFFIHIDAKLISKWDKKLKAFWKVDLNPDGEVIRKKSDDEIDELFRLQNLPTKINKDNIPIKEKQKIWEAINDAWRSLISPHLDNLNSPVFDIGKKAENACHLLLVNCQKIFQAEVDDLKDRVFAEVKSILSYDKATAEQLKRTISAGSHYSAEQIAKALTENQKGVEHSLYLLQTWLKQHKHNEVKNYDEWNQQTKNVLDMCNWLVLLSIDPYWWFHKKLQIQRKIEEQSYLNIHCEDMAFPEVVMSRMALRMPRFGLNESNDLIPANYSSKPYLFDYMAEEDSTVIVQEMYKDLQGFYSTQKQSKPSKIPDDEKLFDEIVAAIRSKLDPSSPHDTFYYVIKKSNWKKIKQLSWQNENFCEKLKRELKNRFQFITVEETEEDIRLCLFNEKELLKRIAEIALASA